MSWAATFGVTCDRDDDVPVGLQLEWALRARIVGGELVAGDRLPTLRELAEEVGVNPNTVRAVYARLEREGLIETHHGKGSFVRPVPAAAHLDLVDAVGRATKIAHEAQLQPRDLAAALYVTTDDGAPPAPEAVRRRELRAQIAVLEQALTDLATRHPDVPVGAVSRAAAVGPRLLDADELAVQRDAVLERLVAAHAHLAGVEVEPVAAAAAPAHPPARAKAAKARAAAKPAPKPRGAKTSRPLGIAPA